MEGAIDLLFRDLLKLRTSFSSASEPPILKDRLALLASWVLFAFDLYMFD
jgi:hypothetical protein